MCGFSKKPSVEKLWREKANMQMSWNSPRAVFAHFRDQRKAGTTRRVTGQSRVASPATYRCKWPKTTEILGLHKSVYFPESDYYTRMRTNDVSIVLRRGFCTLVSSLSCLSVYPSVPALAASASVGTSKQRYSRVSLRLFLD